MEKTDTHKLSTVAQQEIRYQVIRLKKQGRERLGISEITGIHPSTVSARWKMISPVAAATGLVMVPL